MANDSVLVVEDAPVSLKLVQVLLARQGYDVHAAGSAEEALEVFQQFHPRMVLTDIGLPGMDGLELTKRLKADPATRDTIVLALTAYAMKNDEQQAFAAGCDGYITKPIDTRSFPGVIRRYLNGDDETSNGTASAHSDIDAEPSVAELQQAFLADGIQQTGRLIGQIVDGLDLTIVRVMAHRWAGAAGSIGFVAIGQVARQLETASESNAAGSRAHMRRLLSTLARMFAEAAEKSALEGDPEGEISVTPPAVEQPPSAAMVSALAGKKFALAGFPPSESALLAAAFEKYQAFSRDLGEDSLPDLDAVRPFDSILINANGAPQAIPQWNKPVLLIGPRSALFGDRPIHEGAEDFLISPWTAEEVVLRCYFAVLRSAQCRWPEPHDAQTEKRRLLVVDDDPTVRALVETTARNAGFECRTAADGGEALDVIRAWQPELVVLDVNMPNKSGLEVLSSLRNDPLTRDTLVILLTALQRETDVVRGFGLGADDYVVKPFSPMELIARLKRLAGKQAGAPAGVRE